MTGERLRQFKHELRTPLNHILGYSDLLFEEADDLNDDKMRSFAKRIKSRGAMLSGALERALGSGSAGMDQTQVDLLRSSIRPMIAEMLALLTGYPELLQKREFQEDLQRIRQAVSQLLNLLEAAPAS